MSGRTLRAVCSLIFRFRSSRPNPIPISLSPHTALIHTERLTEQMNPTARCTPTDVSTATQLAPPDLTGAIRFSNDAEQESWPKAESWLPIRPPGDWSAPGANLTALDFTGLSRLVTVGNCHNVYRHCVVRGYPDFLGYVSARWLWNESEAHVAFQLLTGGAFGAGGWDALQCERSGRALRGSPWPPGGFSRPSSAQRSNRM